MRWFIAGILDKNPNYCWASLCTWAVMDDNFWEILDRDRFSQICKKDGYGTPHAYCGKCEKNGNYYGSKS